METHKNKHAFSYIINNSFVGLSSFKMSGLLIVCISHKWIWEMKQAYLAIAGEIAVECEMKTESIRN